MTPKGKKILKWTLGITAVAGLLTTVYFVFIKADSNPDKDGKADDFTQPEDTATNEVKDYTPAMKNCGAPKTDYDNDYSYIKCNGVWHTKSKPSGSKASVYPNWVSLANNAGATQKLNTRYPNG